MTDSLPKERLDELDALAQAATPGKRHFQHWSSCALPSGDYAESILFDESSEEMTRGLSDADGEFIAALDPDTVRALIERVKTAEAERDALAAKIEHVRAWAVESHDPLAHEGADSSQCLAIIDQTKEGE